MFKRERHITQPQVGDFLLVEPSEADFFFKKSVVLIIDSSKEGYVGLVLNRPHKKMGRELSDFLSLNNVDVFYGGPVGEDRLNFLHNIPFLDGAEKISEDLYLGGDLHQLTDSLLDSSRYWVRFFLGYAGWQSGQLEGELETGQWLLVTDNVEFADFRGEEMWKSMLPKCRDNLKLFWQNYPEVPQMN